MTVKPQQNFRAALGSLVIQRHGALNGVRSISIGQKSGDIQVNVAELGGVPHHGVFGEYGATAK